MFLQCAHRCRLQPSTLEFNVVGSAFEPFLLRLHSKSNQATRAWGVVCIVCCVQDIGAVALAQRVAPNLPIHASTQMSITSAEGAEFAASKHVLRRHAAWQHQCPMWCLVSLHVLDACVATLSPTQTPPLVLFARMCLASLSSMSLCPALPCIHLAHVRSRRDACSRWPRVECAGNCKGCCQH